MEFVWTRHARDALDDRDLEQAWVEKVVRSPSRREADPADLTLIRLYGTVPQLGGKILRVVVCFEKEGRCRVITVFPDRDA